MYKCFVSAEEFSSTAVPRRHRGVSQEQVFLSLCHLFRREGRRSLRGSPDLSRFVANMLNSRGLRRSWTSGFSHIPDVFDRFQQQAAALRSSSSVRGQTGSAGAAGQKIQGNQRKRAFLSPSTTNDVFVRLQRSTTCWTTPTRPETSTAWSNPPSRT